MTSDSTPWLLGELVHYRYLVALTASVWALAVARTRSATALAAGSLHVQCGIGFWIAVLGGSYSVGVDPALTRTLADAVVAATTGDFAQSFVPGVPPAPSLLLCLARLGVPADWLPWIPTLMPLLTAPALAWLVFALWRPRAEAVLGASLWLLFSTSDLGMLQGWGFVPGLWARPGWSLALVGWTAALLVASRLGRRTLFFVTMALVIIALWRQPVTAQHTDLSMPMALAGHGVWLLLGALGLWRRSLGVPHALVFSGLALLAPVAVRAVDPWPALALLRLGLVLASVAPLRILLRRAGRTCIGSDRLRRLARGRLGAAALVFVAASSGFLMRWDPHAVDPVYRHTIGARSASAGLDDALSWLGSNAPPTSVIMAAAKQAPWVAIGSGRRVWTAPWLVTVPDPDARHVTALRLLHGNRRISPDDPRARSLEADPGPIHLGALLARRRGLTHVLIDTDGLGDLEVPYPEALAQQPGLRLCYQDRWRVQIYEVDPTYLPGRQDARRQTPPERVE